MARSMPTASNPRRPSRPAQGKRTDTPFARPRPAYARDNGAPRVINAGSLSHPKPVATGPLRGKRLTADTTPRVIQL